MERLRESHAVGATTPPLIEDPIGRSFRAVAKRFPRSEALVSRHQGVRMT